MSIRSAVLELRCGDTLAEATSRIFADFHQSVPESYSFRVHFAEYLRTTSVMGWLCSSGECDNKCIEDFGAEIFGKVTSWNVEKEFEG
jgi:hypothetical protein